MSDSQTQHLFEPEGLRDLKVFVSIAKGCAPTCKSNIILMGGGIRDIDRIPYGHALELWIRRRSIKPCLTAILSSGTLKR